MGNEDGNKARTPPPLPSEAVVTSGVRGVTTDTAVFPAPPRPVPGAAGGAATPLDTSTSVLVDAPPQPEDPSPGSREQLPPMEERIFERLRGQVSVLVGRTVGTAQAAIVEEMRRFIDDQLKGFWEYLSKSLEERLGRLTDDVKQVLRGEFGDKFNELRSALGSKPDRSEVERISSDVGSLRGDVAAFRESTEGLKGADEARREALTEVNRQVHDLVGTVDTFRGRIKAMEEGVNEARGELAALHQADTGLHVELTGLRTKVGGIERQMEELRGTLRGIREEALPEVRNAAARAERAAEAANARVMELLPRLQYVEDLATEMRHLRAIMDRVAALEGWRDRHTGDIAEVAARVGLNELVKELRGALPPEQEG